METTVKRKVKTEKEIKKLLKKKSSRGFFNDKMLEYCGKVLEGKDVSNKYSPYTFKSGSWSYCEEWLVPFNPIHLGGE